MESVLWRWPICDREACQSPRVKLVKAEYERENHLERQNISQERGRRSVSSWLDHNPNNGING